MKFQNYWSALINLDEESQQEYTERILEHVGKFRAKSMKRFKRIIDEMS